MATNIETLGEAIEYKQCPAIYILKNNINGKVYVGETMNLRQRVYSYHKSNMDTLRPILRAINKHGLENFSFEYQYHPNFSKDELLDLEEKLIKEHNSLMSGNGYNVCSRGQNRYSATQSLEARKKRKEIFKGRILNEEWRRNMSKSKTGKNHPMYGKKLSEETRKKMGDSRRGEKNYKFGKETDEKIKYKLMMNRKDRIEVAQYTKSGEFVAKYPSIREAARQTGIDSRYINPVCDKIGRSAKGFIWKKVIIETK
jgi:group I intron endonuclease